MFCLEKSQRGRPRKELDGKRCTGPKVSQRVVRCEDRMGGRRWWGRKSYRSQCPVVQRAIGSVRSRERPITRGDLNQDAGWQPKEGRRYL